MALRVTALVHERRHALTRMLPLVAAALLGSAFAGSLAALLTGGWVAVRDPFGLDYGEGIVWQQMLNIMAGRGYAPLGTFPGIVYHYPPVYHVATALLARATGSDALAAGRALSLTATLVTAGLLGVLAAMLARACGHATGRLPGWVGGLAFLACGPVVQWSAMMRVDMLAGALTAGGLILALRAAGETRSTLPAAICFVLAIYTKQVMVAGPAAAMLGLAAVRPRAAVRLAGECLLLGGVALAALSWVTAGGFLRHIVLYNVNRNELSRLTLLAAPLVKHGLLVALAGAGAVRTTRQLRADWANRAGAPQHVATLVTLLAYLLGKTLLLGMIVKSGGNANYLIEWFGAVAVFVGLTLAPSADLLHEALAGRARDAVPAMLIALPVLLAVQIRSVPDEAAETIAHADYDRTAMPPLVELVHRARRPVISDEMTLLIRAGRPVLWEPSITAELGSKGRYDEAGFVRMVQAHRFAFFLTQGDRGDWLFDSRYNPAVSAAMAHFYPVERRYGYLTLHLPPWIDPASLPLPARAR